MKQDIKLAVDAVVFGYEQEKGVSVLLIKRKIEPFRGMWALPGGLVLNEESLDDAVKRELREETGIAVNYLEQLYSFGDPGRDPRNRVVTISYFGLVRSGGVQINPQTDAEDGAWFDLKKLPKLAFDHRKIIDTAIKRLRGKLGYEPIGFELLEKSFPFSHLEELYQTLWDQSLDRRNFRKKIMTLGVVEPLPEVAPRRGQGRPARLYRFNKKRYQQLKATGYNADFF